jgi:hypothetical protein
MFGKYWEKIKKWYRAMPDKKRYIEFITALLTIPVLLTVLITNLSNIKQNNNKPIAIPAVAPQPTAVSEKIIIVTQPQIITPTSSACKPEVGPIKITKPIESELVTADAACVEVSYVDNQYCPVKWAYRVNGGNWSSLSNNNFCLYNLTPGPSELDLDVQSTVSGDEITLVRNFYYKNRQNPTATPTPTITPGITITP